MLLHRSWPWYSTDSLVDNQNPKIKEIDLPNVRRVCPNKAPELGIRLGVWASTRKKSHIKSFTVHSYSNFLSFSSSPISLTSLHSPEPIYSHFASLPPAQSSTIISLLLLNWTQKHKQPFRLAHLLRLSSTFLQRIKSSIFAGNRWHSHFCGVSLSLTFNFSQARFSATHTQSLLWLSHLDFSSQDQRLHTIYIKQSFLILIKMAPRANITDDQNIVFLLSCIRNSQGPVSRVFLRASWIFLLYLILNFTVTDQLRQGRWRVQHYQRWSRVSLPLRP